MVDKVPLPTGPAQPGNTSAGPTTKDDWIAINAISTMTKYANGVDITNPFYSNTSFDSRGLTKFDPAYMGAGQGSDQTFTYATAAQAAQYAFDHWNELSDAEKAGFLNPIAANGKPLPDVKYQDPKNIIDAYNAESGRISAEAGAQADLMRGQAALISANAAAADAANRLTVGMAQVAADNARTQSQERIARDDRTESARQFNLKFGEDQRQFDLNLGEDRRQFNATMAYNLLQTGVQLAAKPVDWVAHQYYMANLGIPLNFLNFNAAQSLFGAIPPTGPSAAGAVVGGPGAMDGDTQLAQMAGVSNPGFVSLTEAVTSNPGIAAQIPGSEFAASDATLTNIANQAGGIQNVESQLASARMTELPATIGDNPVVQAAVQQSQQLASSTEAQIGQGTPVGPIAADSALPPAEAPPPAAPTGAYGKPLTNVAGAWYDGAAQPGMVQDFSQVVPQGVSAPQTGLRPSTGFESAGAPPIPAATGTGMAPADNRGPQTGAPTEQAATNFAPTSSGASGLAAINNPQGELLIQTLAAQLGVSADTIRSIVPTNLMAGGYSIDAIRNSPIVQSLAQHQDRLSGYRTAPAETEKFSQIQAFGIPLGIRSGQDINAGLLLKSNPDQQQMLQGAIEATGQYYPTALAQSLRSSPATSYGVGAFGRRSFA